MQKIIAIQPEIIGFQEVKIPPAGPSNKELAQLSSLLPGCQIKWRAAQKPAKTSYAGTMVLYHNGLHPQIIRPTIDKHWLDNEGRRLVLEFDNYFVVNAYIPHYEYHLAKQHVYWMKELMAYLKKINQQKPLMVAGDLAILLPATTTKSTVAKKTIVSFNQQYQALLDIGLADAYQVAPNGNPAATWWAPNIAKQADRGVQTDFWLVSKSLKAKIKQSGPLDTGERRDHAPIELGIAIR
jgi:exodeoxyribonuclease-3